MPPSQEHDFGMAVKDRSGAIACEVGDMRIVVDCLEKSVERLTVRLESVLRQRDLPPSPVDNKAEQALPALGEDLRTLRKRLGQLADHINQMADNCEL